MTPLSLSPHVEATLRRAHYGIYAHGAVAICRWTKESLKGGEDCYKRKFYGIDTWACMEFTPLSVWCHNNCIHCWRPMEFFQGSKLNPTMLVNPEELVEGLLTERARLLNGYWGNPEVDRQKLTESLAPSHYAISLSGEPTLYPKLPELIKYIQRKPRTKSIFLVTNGQEPEILTKLSREDALPTQLYLSMNVPDERLYLKLNLPERRDFWERFNRSLSYLNTALTKTVIRLTCIKSLNMSPEHISKYVELIERGHPHFVEVKAYMHIGRSTKRLTFAHMPTHEDIVSFARELEKSSSTLRIIDESPRSRVVLLRNVSRPMEEKAISR